MPGGISFHAVDPVFSTEMHTRAVGLVALTLVAHVLGPSGASAQRLTGTYIRHLAVGDDGAMVRGMESMAYGEMAGGTVSCDLFYPGTSVEGFTIQVAGATLKNSATTATDAFTTTTPPTVSGRTITWRGERRTGVSLDVEQIVTYQPDDRVAIMTVRVTNAGTTTLTDLYYLRNGDPDHGSCNIGTVYTTANDVRRQPPIDTSALATALAGSSTTIVLGIGSRDTRARVHNGGFDNSNAIAEWATPRDGAGAVADEAVDIVFRHASLAPGASTTFEILYVWGTSVAEVEARFDLVAPPCTGADGSTCSDASGAAGSCWSGRCCTGCWDGASCHAAGTVSACGIAGATCVDCDDANACTTDTCLSTAGTCFHAGAPSGASCDDGLFCTVGDRCDGAGGCVSGSSRPCDDGSSCTIDSCNETSDACSHAPVASGCIIGSTCYAAGVVDPSNPCRVCDPARSGSDWSIALGADCGTASCAGGVLTRAPTCDASGTCVPSGTVACPTGACSSPTMCDAPCVSDDECGEALYCDLGSGQCRPRSAPGAVCERDGECAAGSVCSADGRCCDRRCDAICESCALGGREGFCSPVPAGSDPNDDCPFGACTEEQICEGPALDAGPLDDAGSPRDGGTPPEDASRPDAGGRSFATYGCCGIAGAGSNSGASLALFALLAIAVAVRRRRRGRTRPNG